MSNEQQGAIVPAQQPAKALVSIGQRGLQPADMDQLWRAAQAVAKSGLAPKGIDTPEAVFGAMEMGLELGLPLMASLQNIAVVNGRPSLFGDAALALVRSSGQLESYAEEEIGEAGKDSHGYKVTVKRRGCDPQSETFTVADAKTAKLWGKNGPWTDYPRRMLKFRARGFVLRDTFGDILKGLRTTEEVRDMPAEINVTPADKVAAGLTAQL